MLSFESVTDWRKRAAFLKAFIPAFEACAGSLLLMKLEIMHRDSPIKAKRTGGRLQSAYLASQSQAHRIEWMYQCDCYSMRSSTFPPESDLVRVWLTMLSATL